jgi:hypothetical protein
LIIIDPATKNPDFPPDWGRKFDLPSVMALAAHFGDEQENAQIIQELKLFCKE